MAHSQQSDFIALVKQHLPQHFAGRRVLEVGSLDINGSIRGHFEACDYVGADLAAGRGVDVVCPGQLLGFPSGHFDVALSCECFEHNPFWVETFSNMLRMTREDGLVLMTCASTGRREHGTARSSPDASPFTTGKGWTYYRNLTARDFERRFDLAGWFSDWLFIDAPGSYDLFLVGSRPAGPVLTPALKAALRQAFAPTASGRAFKRYVKRTLFGDAFSSPLSAYLSGRR